jgi:hypothetical protein
MCFIANIWTGTTDHIGADEPSALNSKALPIPAVYPGTSAMSMVNMVPKRAIQMYSI